MEKGKKRAWGRILGLALTGFLALGLGFSAQAQDTEPKQNAGKNGPPDWVYFANQVEMGNISKVKEWLVAGMDPNYVGVRIGTGLMIAAWEGNVPMMELFVAHGADINRQNLLKEQALMHAAWKGRLDAVKWLVERGAQVNRPDMQWGPLHYASFAGHQEVMKYLLEKGADINARMINGGTPLMMAIYEGKIEAAQYLIEKGADKKVKNDFGDDAMIWAMRHNQLKIAKLMATPEDFAWAASQPKETWGRVARSAPLPVQLADKEKEIRKEETTNPGGDRAKELKKELAEGLALLARAKPIQMAPTPSGLAIVGDKAGTREKVELLFSESYLKDPFKQGERAPVGAPKKAPAQTGNMIRRVNAPAEEPVPNGAAASAAQRVAPALKKPAQQ